MGVAAKKRKKSWIDHCQIVGLVFIYGSTCWGLYVDVVSLGLHFYGAKHGAAAGGLVVLISLALYLLQMTSYTAAVFTPPGNPADTAAADEAAAYSYLPSFSSLNNNDPVTEEYMSAAAAAVAVKQNGRPRFCQKCEFRKPDRCHHCSMCNSCVLKMDHHCPWLANCIGFRNQKYFVLFLIHLCVFCGWSGVIAGIALWNYIEHATMGDFLPVQWALLFVVSAIVFLFVGLFAGWHIGLVLRNLTTIETFENVNYKVEEDNDTKNPFTFGWKANWKQVMGDSPWVWFLPLPNA